tara:strand:- start:727 stop:2172 length:1446 start_codon:yes stop_codon:yes gene_type:complete
MIANRNLLIWISFWGFLGLFLFTTGGRLFYPYQLEWMEGETLIYLARLSENKALYIAPTLEWTPFLYNFLYFYTCYALNVLVTDGLIAGRLISTLSILGTAFLLFIIVRDWCGERVFGILAAAIFLASYIPSGAWFDLARVDSLFIFFITVAIWGLMSQSKLRSAIICFFSLLMAFLVKQSALSIAPFFCLALYLKFQRIALIVSVGLVVSVSLITLGMDLSTGGWYSYYIFQLASEHKWITHRYWSFFTHDLLFWFFPATLIVIIAIRNNPRTLSASIYLIAIGLFVCSYLSRLHNGGYVNVLIPAHLAIAIITSRSVFEVFQTEKPGLHAVTCLLIVAQMGICFYNPLAYLPSHEDLLANRKVVKMLHQSPGEVWIPYHSYLAHLADKPRHSHILAMVDVKQSDSEGVALSMEDELLTKIKNQMFTLIILDEWDRYGMDKAFLKGKYEKIGMLFDNKQTLIPKSGYRTRPQWVFLPKID